MPLAVYFKSPPMTLLFEGEIDKATIRKLKGVFGKVLKLKNPDGQNVVLIANTDSDISYVAEITQEKMDDMMKKQAADRARNLGKKDGLITPIKGVPGRGFRPGGN